MTNTPHDAFFKGVFEDPRNAAAELQVALPERIASAIRWESLKLESGDYTDPDLAWQRSDLLFSAELAVSSERVMIFVLFEHQSAIDSMMALRLLGYMVRIWERFEAANPGKSLPLIIPALLSHVPGGWTAATHFSGLFSPRLGEFASLLPDFAYAVDDLSKATDGELRSRRLGDAVTAALWLLRDARDASDFLAGLLDWLPTLEAVVSAPGGQKLATQMLQYVALVADRLRFQEFCDRIRGLAPATEELAMTIAEELRAEGRLEGRTEGKAEGELKGKAESLFLFLQARGLHLTEVFRAKVLKCTDVDVLDGWLQRAAGAERLEDIFEG